MKVDISPIVMAPCLILLQLMSMMIGFCIWTLQYGLRMVPRLRFHLEERRTCYGANMDVDSWLYMCSSIDGERHKCSIAWLGHGVSPRV